VQGEERPKSNGIDWGMQFPLNCQKGEYRTLKELGDRVAPTFPERREGDGAVKKPLTPKRNMETVSKAGGPGRLG